MVRKLIQMMASRNLFDDDDDEDDKDENAYDYNQAHCWNCRRVIQKPTDWLSLESSSGLLRYACDTNCLRGKIPKHLITPQRPVGYTGPNVIKM